VPLAALVAITQVWAADLPAPDCPSTVPVTTVTQTTGAATASFAGLDVAGFEGHADTLWQSLPCVDEPLGPLEVADIYAVRALDAFLDGQTERVEHSMASLRHAVPGYRLSTAIAPKGHPLRAAYDAAETSPLPPTDDLPVPSEARLLVDGQPVLSRPTDRAVLLQLLTAEGEVRFTSLLEADAPTPAYEAISDDYRAAYLSEAKVIRVRQRRPIELVVASSVALGGAAAMYGLSRGARAEFLDPTTPTPDLAGLRARTNSLQTASLLTGLAGAGLGVAAAVAW